MHKASIIIPYYKKKKFINRTLKSVLKQTYRNLEIIIIYDDQERKDLKFIKQLINSDKRISLITNKKSIGAGLSRNKGIKNAKGKYLAFCDADDIWLNNKLKIQLNFMKKNKLIFSHSNYNIIDSNNNKIGQFRINPVISYNDLIQSCDIGLSTVIIDKKLFSNKNKFCELKTKEDYFLWLNIIKDIKLIYGINKFLVSWRYTKGSLSDSFFQKLSDAYKLYHYYKKFSIIKSIFYVTRLSFKALIKKTKIYNL